jgi:hypothetical protein
MAMDCTYRLRIPHHSGQLAKVATRISEYGGPGARTCASTEDGAVGQRSGNATPKRAGRRRRLVQRRR